MRSAFELSTTSMAAWFPGRRATKVLTHPLVSRTAQAPDGWSHDFAPQVSRAVLFGFSAFTAEDARDAGRRVLARGPARVKLPLELGGRGQYVVADAEERDDVIDTLDPTALTETGVVIEANCEDVTTFSVGQIRAAGIVASYCGTPRLTTDNDGGEVYGGSELFVVRGGFCERLESPLGANAITAVAKARAYDRAARTAYPHVLASRCNYDVIEGLTPDGRRESGVLEPLGCVCLTIDLRGHARHEDLRGSVTRADNLLANEPSQRAYTSLLINWLTEMVIGAREGSAHEPVAPRRTPEEVEPHPVKG